MTVSCVTAISSKVPEDEVRSVAQAPTTSSTETGTAWSENMTPDLQESWARQIFTNWAAALGANRTLNSNDFIQNIVLRKQNPL